jgi:hypothetical protein
MQTVRESTPCWTRPASSLSLWNGFVGNFPHAFVF